VALDPRPGVRLGAIALWLIVALPLSFQLKRRRLMSHRAWRFLHRFGYATWVLALCHGVLSGSDTASPFARLAYGLGAMLVVGAAWWRWFELPVPGSPRPGGSPRPSEGSA